MKFLGFLISTILFTFQSYGRMVPDSISSGDSLKIENLKEVQITAGSARQRMSSLQLGAEKLELSKLAVTPVLFGENDIIKSIALLPGVHAEGDGAGGFEVRGGNSSQNLTLLDGITLYSPTHVMGIFSTFNDQAISQATLFKGPLPPSFGEASSSVLETGLKNGDMEDWNGAFTVGILAAKLKVGGPIVKNRLSFAVTARRSYVDAFLKIVPRYRDIVMNFYDVTAKLRYKAGNNDYLDMAFISSRDNMAIGGVMGMYWGNVGSSLNWFSQRGEGWHFNTTAAFTSFSTRMDMTMMNSSQFLKEYIKNLSLEENISYLLDEDHSIEGGYRSEFLRVQSADFTISGNRERDVKSGWNNALWLNYEGRLIGGFYLSGGVRFNLFTTLKGRRFNRWISNQEPVPSLEEKTYFTPEPRLSLKWAIKPEHNLKAGFSLTSQSLHSLRSSTTSFPFDRYAISTSRIHPEKVWQYVAGYNGMTSDGAFEWSAEGYYKSMRNIYDYKDGYSMFSRLNLEDIILGGQGRSFGLEIMFRKNTGRLTGWLSYCLSKTESKIVGINNGEWYDAGNDRRHDLSLVGIYKFNDRWTLSGSWIFSSGTPLTAPDVKYELSGTTIYYYSKRNAYRIPSTHRLDLSATYSHVGRKFTYEWSFGVYNLYCRYNPYIVYFEDDPESPSESRAVLRAMFGLVPSVSYTLKF
ncbi:MAG: TonB-dependent receptor plug domain-containing protein [Muribaculaceae bacterium]|nr:TonB-dependent receptor plug domain-containing protein [Muribaculaceae bacterium]